jgi:solute:Na+ symporter, SSS family
VITVLTSTIVWLATTMLTAPEKKEVLLAFYRRTRPSAALWGPIAKEATDVPPTHDGLWNLLDWFAGCVLVYLTLFGVGKIIFGQPEVGIAFLAIAAAAGCVLYWDLNRRGWKTVLE